LDEKFPPQLTQRLQRPRPEGFHTKSRITQRGCGCLDSGSRLTGDWDQFIVFEKSDPIGSQLIQARPAKQNRGAGRIS
jgi:hypothetical protein